MDTEPEFPARDTIEAAMESACQAPSLHNSQPWRWVVQGRHMMLYLDSDWMLPFTDPNGRQMIISCGAVLHHLHVALAASGWATTHNLLPQSHHPNHLATLAVTGRQVPDARVIALAAAIDRRRSDRLPFKKPDPTALAEHELREVAAAFDVQLDLLTDDDRPELEFASELAAVSRRYDQQYQDELRWWAGHSPSPEGVPREALLSGLEHDRVAIGRKFPSTDRLPRRADVPDDRAAILSLSTTRDSLPSWLRCGEAMSAVLLTCTANGLATCPLTHLTELSATRTRIAQLLDEHDRLPQVLIRTGVIADLPTRRTTRRRPTADMVTFKDSTDIGVP